MHTAAAEALHVELKKEVSTRIAVEEELRRRVVMCDQLESVLQAERSGAVNVIGSIWCQGTAGGVGGGRF